MRDRVYIVCLPGRIGYHLKGFTLNLTGIYLNGFTPNSTGQIGWKSTEITLYACLVKLGIISVDFHPI